MIYAGTCLKEAVNIYPISLANITDIQGKKKSFPLYKIAIGITFAAYF